MIQATLITDTREQLAYALNRYKSQHVAFALRNEKLNAGDYAAWLANDDPTNLANVAVVERKTHADLLGTLTHGRKRFERELEKLQAYGFAAIVIEADIPSIIRGTANSNVNSRAVIASLIAFSQRFGVHVVFASNRKFAELYAFRLLERWCRDRAEARKAEVA